MLKHVETRVPVSQTWLHRSCNLPTFLGAVDRRPVVDRLVQAARGRPSAWPPPSAPVTRDAVTTRMRPRDQVSASRPAVGKLKPFFGFYAAIHAHSYDGLGIMKPTKPPLAFSRQIWQSGMYVVFGLLRSSHPCSGCAPASCWRFSGGSSPLRSPGRCRERASNPGEAPEWVLDEHSKRG